jgi:hypothetical protein
MQFLVSVIDDGQALSAGRNDSASEAEATAVDRFNERLQADGNWVFAAGLAAPATATLIDNRGDAPLLTDGPFVESREYVAGLWIMRAPDLDAALRLATEASAACNRKIEVRALLE